MRNELLNNEYNYYYGACIMHHSDWQHKFNDRLAMFCNTLIVVGYGHMSEDLHQDSLEQPYSCLPQQSPWQTVQFKKSHG